MKQDQDKLHVQFDAHECIKITIENAQKKLTLFRSTSYNQKVKL